MELQAAQIAFAHFPHPLHGNWLFAMALQEDSRSQTKRSSLKEWEVGIWTSQPADLTTLSMWLPKKLFFLDKTFKAFLWQDEGNLRNPIEQRTRVASKDLLASQHFHYNRISNLINEGLHYKLADNLELISCLFGDLVIRNCIDCCLFYLPFEDSLIYSDQAFCFLQL